MPAKQLAVLVAVAIASASAGVVITSRMGAEVEVDTRAEADARLDAHEVSDRRDSAEEVEADEPAERRGVDVTALVETAGNAAGLGAARTRANESAAIATLRSIVAAEAQNQWSAAIDVDQDGVGEHAYLAEMAGRVPLRGPDGPGDELLVPPVLIPSLGDISPAGNAERSGYRFRIYLPGETAGASTPGFAEAAGGGCGADVPDPDNSEVLWCVYAWPIEAGRTGSRTFFANQEGEIIETPNADGGYSGENAPAFDAALSDESPGDMFAPLATRCTANDGREWSTVR